MNHEVEREEGELAKLRLFRERVMALPRYDISLTHTWADPDGNWIRAADIDAIAREVGSE